MGIKVLQNFIDGKWVDANTTITKSVTNPALDEITDEIPLSNKKDVDEAVRAAKQAFPAWREAPLVKRIELLSQLKTKLEAKKLELVQSITQEHGKVMRDSEGEVTRALENLAQACNPTLLQSKYLSNISTGDISEYSRLVPLGVFCGITPFNFPLMIPFWFFPYALLTGNTYILKPSEQTPITISKVFEVMSEIFPPGVINLIHGDLHTVRKLITHKDVIGVSSVSSSATMKSIWEQATKAGKRAQCQGGAKNVIVITEGVDIEKVVPHVIDSVFGNTGQRCLAGSNVVIMGSNSFYNAVLKETIAQAKKLRVGNGLMSNMDIGPLISKQAKERVINYIEKGGKDEATLALDGRAVIPFGDPNGYWLGPTIFTNVNENMSIACDEIFGPVMTVMHKTTIESVLSVLDKNPYGNAIMIFTDSGKIAQTFKNDAVLAGNIGINVGLPAPIPPFSFGGMKNSFRGDLHGQGAEAIEFFTDRKIIIERWF